jgi:ribosome modulation factor
MDYAKQRAFHEGYIAGLKGTVPFDFLECESWKRGWMAATDLIAAKFLNATGKEVPPHMIESAAQIFDATGE